MYVTESSVRISSNLYLAGSTTKKSPDFGNGWLFGLNDISTFVGHLTPNPFLCK